MRRFGRQATSFLLIALMATGCTHTVEVPIFAQLEGDTIEHEGKHYIWTNDDSKYITRGFTVGDSTIVITRLDRSDARYRKNAPPISLSMRDVQKVEKVEEPGLAFDLFMVVACVAVIYAIAFSLFAGSMSGLGSAN